MCMLFLYLSDTPGDGGYRLILASNRDEYWQRPTATADFRGDNCKWFGGADLEPGREGGTWLGISTTGKIGVLLNILAVQKLDLEGRGSLVTNFLQGNQTCSEYLQGLSHKSDRYNPFQLVLLDLGSQEQQGVHYLTNSNDTNDHVRHLPTGTYGVDNSVFEKPWRKRVEGQRLFSDVVQAHGSPSDKDKLVNELMNILNDKSQYMPDVQLEKQFADVGYETTGWRIQERSARNVFSPSIQYGTRTNTVILVDHQGRCEYIERTLTTPVDVDHPSWTTKEQTFTISKSCL